MHVKPMPQWPARSAYSIDDSCDGNDANDNDIVTLGTQNLNTWMLVYR